MATVATVPLSPLDDRHIPVVSTLDPTFSPAGLHLAPYTTRPFSSSPTPSSSSSDSPTSADAPGFAVPMGSRYEKVPYDGPGTAVYVRQPTRAQLRESNGLFGSVNRPYFYQDPRGKPFIDIDGKECGVRWIYVDPKARHGGSRDDKADKIGCCIM